MQEEEPKVKIKERAIHVKKPPEPPEYDIIFEYPRDKGTINEYIKTLLEEEKVPIGKRLTIILIILLILINSINLIHILIYTELMSLRLEQTEEGIRVTFDRYFLLRLLKPTITFVYQSRTLQHTYLNGQPYVDLRELANGGILRIDASISFLLFNISISKYFFIKPIIRR